MKRIFPMKDVFLVYPTIPLNKPFSLAFIGVHLLLKFHSFHLTNVRWAYCNQKKKHTERQRTSVCFPHSLPLCAFPTAYRPVRTHVYLKPSLGFYFTKMGHAILLGSPGVIQGPGRCGRCAGGSAGTRSPCEAGATQTPKLVCGGSCRLPSTLRSTARSCGHLPGSWPTLCKAHPSGFSGNNPLPTGCFHLQNALQNTRTWTLQYRLF